MKSKNENYKHIGTELYCLFLQQDNLRELVKKKDVDNLVNLLVSDNNEARINSLTCLCILSWDINYQKNLFKYQLVCNYALTLDKIKNQSEKLLVLYLIYNCDNNEFLQNFVDSDGVSLLVDLFSMKIESFSLFSASFSALTKLDQNIKKYIDPITCLRLFLMRIVSKIASINPLNVKNRSLSLILEDIFQNSKSLKNEAHKCILQIGN